jgi:hypothetical protein
MPVRTVTRAVLLVLLVLLVMQAQALVQPGRITVWSSPSYAKVCIDNQRCDRTPADFPVTGDTWHTVNVTAAGYLPWSDDVFVTSGQASLVSADLLSPTTGLRVNVTPGGGTVCIDDSLCHTSVGLPGGSGSTQFTRVNEGYHTIKVNQTDGYRSFSMLRYVTSKGITFTITLDPVSAAFPETGTIQVLVNREGSTVCIDNGNCRANVVGPYGSGTGIADFPDTPANVPHMVSVTADGYDPWSVNISISPDQVNTLRVSLHPLTVTPVLTPATTLPTPRPTRAFIPPGRITVISVPSSAKVCIDDGKCDRTPADFGVSGNAWHEVSVTQSGYLAWTENIYVLAGQATLVSADLQPGSRATGVQVFVNPGGGTVCIDDNWCNTVVGSPGGSGSTQFAGVSEGFHTFKVNNTDGYRMSSVQRFVAPKGITAIYINLDPVSTASPETGTIRVSVNRFGSTVCIDGGTCRQNVGGMYGAGTGITDFAGVTANAVHAVTVTADGYLTCSTMFLVSPGQVNTVKVSLQPLVVTRVPQPDSMVPTLPPARPFVAPGRITVLSRPPYAHVCIDDRKCDTTPADFVVTGNAPHMVNITQSGYLDWSESIYIPAGRTSLVNATLQRDTGTNGIQVFVKPGGGTVCLDTSQCHTGVGSADSIGSTQFSELSEGNHIITVNNTAGYRLNSTRLYVAQRGFISISITLDPLFAPATRPTDNVGGFVTILAGPETGSPTPVPPPGRIRVYVNPTGSTVCLDAGDCRTNVGGTAGPGTGFVDFSSVPANVTHTISVTEDGFQPASSQVTVSPGKVSTVNFVLQPAPVTTPVPPTPEPAPLPTRSAPGAVPVLSILAICGAFILLRRVGK